MMNLGSSEQQQDEVTLHQQISQARFDSPIPQPMIAYGVLNDEQLRIP